jgi:hypothetical protein
VADAEDLDALAADLDEALALMVTQRSGRRERSICIAQVSRTSRPNVHRAGLTLLDFGSEV